MWVLYCSRVWGMALIAPSKKKPPRLRVHEQRRGGCVGANVAEKALGAKGGGAVNKLLASSCMASPLRKLCSAPAGHQLLHQGLLFRLKPCQLVFDQVLLSF